MKTSFPPVVKFGKNAPDYDTYTFSNGSWSSSDADHPNDTWTATKTITSQMPSGDYHISVTAQGEDGSQLDQDENLAEYNPGNDTLHPLFLSLLKILREPNYKDISVSL